jgi:hypothetical protein
MSLTQLEETLHYICRGLLNKKNKIINFAPPKKIELLAAIFSSHAHGRGLNIYLYL